MVKTATILCPKAQRHRAGWPRGTGQVVGMAMGRDPLKIPEPRFTTMCEELFPFTGSRFSRTGPATQTFIHSPDPH